MINERNIIHSESRVDLLKSLLRFLFECFEVKLNVDTIASQNLKDFTFVYEFSKNWIANKLTIVNLLRTYIAYVIVEFYTHFFI